VTIPATLTTIDTNVDTILNDTSVTIPATLAVIQDDTSTTIPGLVNGLQNISSGTVSTAVAAALVDIDLDHVANLSAPVASSNSFFGMLMYKDDSRTFSKTTDSNEAIRDYTSKGIQKSVALNNIPVLMVDSTDHVTPKTGLTLTEEVSRDASAFAAAAGSSAEIANGWYQFDASGADMSGGIVIFKFTATGADATQITFITSG
jgi:hypothetical protein